jgi:hypothetical protein
MEQGCKAFVDRHIKGKEGSPVAIYEPIRAFLIEMPLRLILGLGDTAPEIVSTYNCPIQCNHYSFLFSHKLVQLK